MIRDEIQGPVDEHVAARERMEDVAVRMEKRDAKYHTGSSEWLGSFNKRYIPRGTLWSVA